MCAKDKTKQDSSQQLIDMLNQALTIEYSMMIHYPRLARAIRDKDSRRVFESLGQDSNRHGDVISKIICELGGQPDWSIEPAPDDTDMVAIIETQLEKEKFALHMHKQCVGLAKTLAHREKLCKLVKEEQGHIKDLENILSNL